MSFSCCFPVLFVSPLNSFVEGEGRFSRESRLSRARGDSLGACAEERGVGACCGKIGGLVRCGQGTYRPMGADGQAREMTCTRAGTCCFLPPRRQLSIGPNFSPGRKIDGWLKVTFFYRKKI